MSTDLFSNFFAYSQITAFKTYLHEAVIITAESEIDSD